MRCRRSAARLSACPLASSAPRSGRRERQPQLPRSSRLDCAHVPSSARAASGCVACQGHGHLIRRMSVGGGDCVADARREWGNEGECGRGRPRIARGARRCAQRPGGSACTRSGIPWGLRRIACAFEGRALRATCATGSTRPLSVDRWIASSTRRSASPSWPEGSGSRRSRMQRAKPVSSAAIWSRFGNVLRRGRLTGDLHLDGEAARVFVGGIEPDASLRADHRQRGVIVGAEAARQLREPLARKAEHGGDLLVDLLEAAVAADRGAHRGGLGRLGPEQRARRVHAIDPQVQQRAAAAGAPRADVVVLDLHPERRRDEAGRSDVAARTRSIASSVAPSKCRR